MYPVVLPDESLGRESGPLNATEPIVLAGLAIDTEMRGAPGIVIRVAPVNTRRRRVRRKSSRRVLMATVITGDGPALCELTSKKSNRIGQRPVDTSTPHQLEIPAPRIGKIDLEADAVHEMVGILRAHPLVDHTHDIAVSGQAPGRRVVSRADDLYVRECETVETRAGHRRSDRLARMRNAHRPQ